MPSINIVHDQLVQLAKDKNLTYKEILVKLAEYRKALKIFKARLPLVKCLEINLPDYNHSKHKPDGYQKIENQHLFNFLHTPSDIVVKSYKVTFVDGTYYHWRCQESTSYTIGYNRLVVNYIANMLDDNFN